MKEKWKKFCDKTGVYLSPLLFFISLLLMDLSFRFFHRNIATIGVGHLVPNIFTLCWVLLFTVCIFAIPGKAKKITMSVLVGFFFLLTFAHCVVYHVAGNVISLSDLAFAEDAGSFLSYQYFAFSWKIYVSLFLSLAIGILSVFVADGRKYKWPVYVICAVLFIGFAVGIGVNHYNNTFKAKKNFRWTDTYSADAITSIYTEFTDPNECFMFSGSYQYLFRSISQSLLDKLREGTVIKELNEFYGEKEETPESNAMTGALEGENLIAIMLESIDTWLITEDTMPNLYRLQQKSVDFKNHYTPLYLSAGTFNTEVAFNVGLYLPVTGTSARTYATNVYPQSLPYLFRSAGYTANSYHTLDGKFYNRRTVHPLWGYESFNDHNAMGLVGKQVLDSTLMEGYDMFAGHKESFFSYIITYSGHGPYTEESHHISDDHIGDARRLVAKSGMEFPSENTKDQYTYAIAHAMETDLFVGQLIEAMELDGRINDTTLLFFCDHYSKYLTDTEFVMKLKGISDEHHLCRTPFFIYSDKLQPQSVEKVTSSVDLIPTIANLFGLDYNARYLIGNDAFGTKGGFVCFKDYSWIDSDTYWTTSYSGEETEEILARCKEVKKILSASWKTVKSNYYQHVDIS